MKERYHEIIDELTGKAVPGTTLLLKGPSGRYQDTITFQHIASKLNKGACVTVLLSRISPEKFITHLERYGVNAKISIAEEKLLIIDWYSYTRKVIIGIQEDLGLIRVSRDILNLSIGVNKSVEKIPADGERIAVIDFLDTAVDIFGWETVNEYVRKIMETLRKNEFTSLFLTGNNLNDEIFHSLQKISDGVIHLDKKDDGATIHLESLGLDYDDSEIFEIEMKEGFLYFSGAGVLSHGKVAVEKLGATAKEFMDRKNGRVKGMTNGRLRRKINGRINGTINGKTNGKTNGRVNGTINGKTNGRINGRINGKINGKIDEDILNEDEDISQNDLTSIAAEDGLINGLGGVSGPTIDFSGILSSDDLSLPDEEGLINGFGGNIIGTALQSDSIKDTFDMEELVRGERKLAPRAGGSIWFKKSMGIVTLMLFLLLLPLIVNVIYIPVEERISIDGDFSDWNAVRGYIDPPADHDIESIDIREYKLVESDGFLYMYLQTAGDLFSTGGQVSSIRFFIDTGLDHGYDIGGIVADHMLEIYGWENELKGTAFYGFNQSRDSHDWNGFIHKGGASVSSLNNQLEARVWLGRNSRDVLPKIFIHTMMREYWDTSEGVVIPERDSMVSRIQKVGPRVVQQGSVVPILEMSVFSLSGPAILDSITIEYNDLSDYNIEDIYLYKGDHVSVDTDLDTPIYTVNDYNGTAIIHLEEEINEEIGYYVIAARVSPEAQHQSVVGLKVTEITAMDGIASIQRTRLDNVYVGDIPDEPRINGAFVDWIQQPVWDDEIDDLSPVGTWNPNIDIKHYSATGSASFLVSVNGNMLGGADVPYMRGRPPELKDSDGDGIPDIYDPFPYDFTNDGTPDSEMLTPDGLPDVDGDGVADWPYGPDKWLNTTIPEHPDIPEEYWGREVSRYIGPVILPVRTGEDYLRIFLDTDKNPGTGYTAPWLNLGAEYMIEIRGRNMEVTGAEYYRYSGTRTDWSWELMGEVPVALNSTSIETGLDIRSLGISDDFDVAFVATDWQNNLDTAVINDNNENHWRTRSSTERYELYLRDGDSLLYETGETEISTVLRNQGGQRTNTWTSPTIAGDLEISGTVRLHVYLVPHAAGNNYPGLDVTLSHGGTTFGSGSLPPINSPGWYTISMVVNEHTVPAGDSMVLETTITGEPARLRMDIYHNSGSRNSRISVPSTRFLSVDDVYTLNDSDEEQTIFQTGETVHVDALVSHTFTANLVTSVSMSVYYPDDTLMIDNIGMANKEEDPSMPPYWSLFNSSFTLEDDSPGGIYTVVVSATDLQGKTSSNMTTFIIPVEPGIVVYPDGTKTIEPGTWAHYSVNVQNIGNMDDDYRLTVSKSSRSWTTELRYAGDTIAIDENGDGKWDWVDPEWDIHGDGTPEISLMPQDKMIFTVSKFAPASAVGMQDTTKLFAHSLNYENVYDGAVFTTSTPHPLTSKGLHLHDDSTMDTEVGTSTTSINIAAGGSQTWTQSPLLERDLRLIEYSTVHLYIVPGIQGFRRPDVTVSLSESGTFINSFTIHGIDTEGWYEFPIETNTLLKKGNGLQVTVSSGVMGIDVFYDSETYPSRVDYNTDTYIRVEEVTTYLDHEENSEFSAGDIVNVRARISDPLGVYNLASALAYINDPDGNELVTLPLSLMENGLTSSNEGYWFEGDYQLSEEAPVGEYSLSVTGTDDQGVEDEGNSLFQVPAGVEVDPDNEGDAQAGTIVEYQHTVTNLGRGNDRFELSVSSSLGYNVTLLDDDGNVITETSLLKMGESFTVTVRIEIPGNAESGLEDITTLTATSWRDPSVYDSATDVTSIPEFTNMMLPVGIVFLIFFGWFAHRRFILDKIVDNNKENIDIPASEIKYDKEVVT